jgi:hypothetical protein
MGKPKPTDSPKQKPRKPRRMRMDCSKGKHSGFETLKPMGMRKAMIFPRKHSGMSRDY